MHQLLVSTVHQLLVSTVHQLLVGITGVNDVCVAGAGATDWRGRCRVPQRHRLRGTVAVASAAATRGAAAHQTPAPVSSDQHQ